MVKATGISTIIHVLSLPNEGGLCLGANLSFPSFFNDHQQNRLDVKDNSSALKSHYQLEYCVLDSTQSAVLFAEGLCGRESFLIID